MSLLDELVAYGNHAANFSSCLPMIVMIIADDRNDDDDDDYSSFNGSTRKRKINAPCFSFNTFSRDLCLRFVILSCIVFVCVAT